MTAAVAVAPEGWMSVSEYLQSSFEPDADYVDGYVEERNLGELDHSTWQLALCGWFLLHRGEWGLLGLPELRLRVSATRVRVPDVCVFRAAERPTEPVPSTPPLAIFEIMSPEDRFGRPMARLQDYQVMGVRNVFVIGNEGNVYRYEDGSLRVLREESSALVGSEAAVRWAEIAELRS